MSTRTALVALLLLTFSIIVPGQANKAFTAGNNSAPKAKAIRLDAEAERALARLGELSLAAVRERLARMRLAAYLPGSLLINKIIAQQERPVVTSERVDRLKAALQPVLAYHQRDKMPIIVVYSDQPRANLVARAAIVITTKLMLITSEAEIRGIVAHELGHEYMWEESKNAQQAKDENAMRECELFCDAVAAVTLKEIGDDPASYIKALERMTYIGIAAGRATRSQMDSHPALSVRQKLNQFLCQQLRESPAPAKNAGNIQLKN